MTEAWYWWSGILAALFLIVMASAVYSTYITNRGADKSKTLESYDGVDDNDGPVPGLVFLGYITFFIGAVVFLVLYPGIGNFPGVLGWSQEDDSVNAHRAPLESRVMGLVSGGADLTELMQQDDIVRAGASVFANHCASCHAQDGRGQHNFPTLTDKDWLYGGDDRHLLATIRHGRNGHMPFWHDRLSAHQVTALSGYIAEGLPQGDTSESVFVVNCAPCHGVRGQGNYAVGGPNLVDDVWLHGDQVDDLQGIIYAGVRNEMPAFDGQLSNGRIYAVASYVASLSRTEAGAYPDVDDFLAGTASLTMTTAACAGCHGVDGAGIEGVAPELAGLSLTYLNTQLLRFRRGERNNRTMQTVLEDMNRADIIVAAEYFSVLPPVTPDVVIREVDAVVAAGEIEDGTVVVETESIVESVSTIPARRGDVVVYDDPFAELANQGDWDRGIPACVTCHLTAAVGSGPFPRLRGRDASYLARQLSAWQQGERSSDPDNMMGSIAKKLTAEEIRGLADYFSKHSLLADTKLDPQPELPAVARDDAADTFRPAPFSEIPEGGFGDKVRAGYTIFVNSQTLRDEFVFNDQNCVNCHLNAGRNANSAPLWGAYFAYPAFRKKNNKINSFSDRIEGCFRYSMNGKVPPKGDDALIAVSAYAYWLGMSGLMNQYGVDGPVPELTDEQLLTGGKVDDFPFPAEVAAGFAGQDVSKLPGRGYPELAAPELDYDIDRGAEVYDRHCLVCHGSDGQGRRAEGISSLPPLWGEGSFNHGAGMHRVNTAAFFIYENMPLGKSIQLTIQEAWDVAAYLTSHERPQDPRFEGDLTATDKEYHHHACYYGDEIDGAALGSQAYPNPE